MDEGEGAVFEPAVAPDALGASEARYRDALLATEAALAKARARSQRNCSPLLNTRYGLIQLGGEEKPTAVNKRVISLIGRWPNPSITARSDGHSRGR